MPDRTVQIQLTGREAETRLPPLLTPAAQTPNQFTLGKAGVFLAQAPFSV